MKLIENFVDFLKGSVKKSVQAELEASGESKCEISDKLSPWTAAAKETTPIMQSSIGYPNEIHYDNPPLDTDPVGENIDVLRTTPEIAADNGKSWSDDFRIISLFHVDNTQKLFFHDDCGKGSRVLLHWCKENSMQLISLPNAFDEDMSRNYLAVFSSQQDLSFAKYCLQIGSALIINRDNPRYGISSYAVQNIPVDDLQTFLVNSSPLSDKRHNGYSRTNRETVEMVLQQLYEIYNEKYNPSCLPRAFIDFLSNTIGLRLCPVDEYDAREHIKREDISPGTLDYYAIAGEWEQYKSLRKQLNEELKAKYNSIYLELLDKGEVQSKWKSEYSVFLIVKKLFPDAVYQYHAPWLSRQSIDIFIPSINLGIEYQGQQHYEAVALFGGEDALSKRKKLDQKKRALCKEQGVSLAEIRYDDLITSAKIKTLIDNHLKK